MTSDPGSGVNRVALVTGAGRRIGRQIALDLGRVGWDLAIHVNGSKAAAEDVANTLIESGRRAVVLQGDLGRADDVATLVPRCIDALGAPSALVNNASIFEFDDPLSMTHESWRIHQKVNLAAPIFLSQAFARALPTDATGNIVNIIDQRVLRPTPEFFSYAMAKAGLWNATRMMAQAFAPRIRVNAVGPGPVLANDHQGAADFAAEVAATPLGRTTPPDEIAAAVRFILDAPSMTGQMIALDAGQHLTWSSERNLSGQ
ncbi:MAG: SDR family oxidoreductase [Pseudomonadota bacterium]